MISIEEVLLVLELGFIYSIAVFGLYITFRELNITDFSCDGSFVAGAAMCAISLQSGCPLWLAMCLSCIAGGCVGLLTALLHNIIRISDVLSGILVSYAMYSINIRIMDDSPNIVVDFSSTIFHQYDVLLFVPLLFVLICGIYSYFIKTEFGLAFRSIGGGTSLPQVLGINTSMMIAIGIIYSNALIALSGGILAQYQGFADISQGFGTAVIGLAAIMIGEGVVSKRLLVARRWLAPLLCLLGSIIYRLVIAFALHADALSLRASDINIITAAIVIGVMLLPKILNHDKFKRKC